MDLATDDGQTIRIYLGQGDGIYNRPGVRGDGNRGFI